MSGLRQRLPVVLPIALAGASLAAGPPDVQTDPRERDIYVSVLDGSGAPVPDLTPADFEVRENGAQREVLRAVPARDPMQIAVLVDNSSASSPAIRDLRQALSSFVAELAGEHEVALVTIGDRPTILVEATRSRDRLEAGIGRIFALPGSGAVLIDSVVDVVRGFQRREAPRPVIVTITTEGPDFSNHFYRTALEQLAESGAMLHSLVLAEGQADLTAPTTRDRNYVLAEGSRTTGGREERILSPMGLERSLGLVAAELTGQYVVTYARPEALIPPDRVQVSVVRPGLRARARTVLRGR